MIVCFHPRMCSMRFTRSQKKKGNQRGNQKRKKGNGTIPLSRTPEQQQKKCSDSPPPNAPTMQGRAIYFRRDVRSSPPEQNVDAGDHREVHICFDLVRHVGPETSPHDHVPSPPVRLLKRFADARSDCCEYLFVLFSPTVPDCGARLRYPIAVPDCGARLPCARFRYPIAVSDRGARLQCQISKAQNTYTRIRTQGYEGLGSILVHKKPNKARTVIFVFLGRSRRYSIVDDDHSCTS